VTHFKYKDSVRSIKGFGFLDAEDEFVEELLFKTIKIFYSHYGQVIRNLKSKGVFYEN
jgi:hypothetical protein